MARKRKTILGQTSSAPAQRQFTDREEPQESFVKALTEVNSREYSILAYYGVGGIGKSSLLNALTNRKSLAKVSSTPGKTRLINYFKVTFLDRESAEKRHAQLVDLPGFGYAKVSKSIKADWEKNTVKNIFKKAKMWPWKDNEIVSILDVACGLSLNQNTYRPRSGWVLIFMKSILIILRLMCRM